MARWIWAGVALAAVGGILTAVSLWLMPQWMLCLITGAGALGGSYRLLSLQQKAPAQARQALEAAQPEAEAAAPLPITTLAPPPAAMPPPPPAALPTPVPGPLVIDVASFQDGQPMGRRQIPIKVSVR